MAKCPKCGRKLTLFDWKPNCPDCGVNLVYYGMEERLLDEADAAEAEHAKLQKRIDRLKASFIGSKLTIARIVLTLLPIATLLLPLCTITYSGPFIEEVTKNIGLIELINVITSLDIDALLTMLGSGIVGTSFIGYAGALVCLLLSVVFIVISLLMLMLACSPKGNPRNITLNIITIALAVASPVFFNIFATNISAVFPDFVSGKIGFGIFVYIAALALLLGINIIIAVKGVNVKYKQCYVGGIPAEEYFELVEKGTDKAVIRQMMAEALEKKATDAGKKEEVKEEANA
ncbi:MAG: hypothetical protein IKK63_06010 [Clostridia bacterium]|nr:hypothetical protein [Clostridia bacterium]MBR3818654.1 hypothetical protein [Clostridia bacterium]